MSRDYRSEPIPPLEQDLVTAVNVAREQRVLAVPGLNGNRTDITTISSMTFGDGWNRQNAGGR